MATVVARLTGFLRQRADQPSMLVFFAGMFIVSQLSIAAVLEPVGIDRVLAMQLTYDAPSFAAQVADLYARGVAEQFVAHYYYDFLHPLWYGVLLALCLGNAFNRNGIPDAWNPWLLVPLVAGAMDLVENSLHLYMVLDTANIAGPLVLAAGGAATLKWSLVVLAMVAAGSLWLRALAGRRPAP